METPFLGMIAIFGFSFAPREWMAAQGQLLSIAQNTALYSLLTTQFGGDGKTTFALPDLQGRVVIGFNGTYPMGNTGGAANVTLTQAQLPAHTHTATFTPSSSGSASMQVSTAQGAKAAPDAGDYLATGLTDGGEGVAMYVTAANKGTTVALGGVSSTGGGGTIAVATSGQSQPFNNMMPYVAMNPCIAAAGLYPSRG